MWLLVCGKQCHTCEHKDLKLFLNLISVSFLFTSTMRKKLYQNNIPPVKNCIRNSENEQLILEQKEEIKNLQKKIKTWNPTMNLKKCYLIKM